MDNSQPLKDNQTSNSEPKNKKLRVERVHGGENVEEIETPELMNDPACPHTSMSRDPSEKDFIAFVCDNPKCGVVKLYHNKRRNINATK